MTNEKRYNSQSPILSRGEYWLLECVVEGNIPICFLDWGKSLEACLNKQGHLMDRAELEKTFCNLFSNQLIEAHYVDQEDAFFPSKEILVRELNKKKLEDNYMSYQLTAKGGVVWENFAKPIWDKYVSPPGFSTDGWDETTAACADKQHLQRYLDGLHYVGVTIDKETIKWSKETPIEMTYWKTLPSGYEVTFNACWDLGWEELIPESYYEVYRNKGWYQWQS